MKSSIKLKEINLPCECAGGSETCGFLRVIDFGDNNYEFCWVKKIKTKKAKKGICLQGKGLKKLRKFLRRK